MSAEKSSASPGRAAPIEAEDGRARGSDSPRTPGTAEIVINDLERLKEETDSPFDAGCLAGAVDLIKQLVAADAEGPLDPYQSPWTPAEQERLARMVFGRRS